jgi:deoxycytidylate deaminase
VRCRTALNSTPTARRNYSRIIHAEINAQIFAGDVRGSTLYTWPFPTCDRCFVQMVQAGIARFVAPTPTAAQRERWGDAWARVDLYTYECNVPYVLLDNAA